MSNLIRLSKSGIEYLDYQWGVYSGCRNLERGICPLNNCWARGLTIRYPGLYPSGFDPILHVYALDSPMHLRKPSRIAVGWVGGLIGYGLQYKEHIYRTIEICPQHTFLFLTKNPECLKHWEPFPENCLVGVTVCNDGMMKSAFDALYESEAKKTFISFEPLLGRIDPDVIRASQYYRWLDGVIIGAQTRPLRLPKTEHVREIIDAADIAGIPVFLKDNLGWPRITADGSPPFYKKSELGTWILRQEVPAWK